MLEQFKYINHLNEVFDFGKNGIFVNENNLRDYEWDVSKKNNRITRLSYSVQKKKIPLVVICDTAEAGRAAVNRLFEITEKDVLATEHGRIVIGRYYLRCFVTASSTTNYLVQKRYMTITLTLQTDFPFWVSENTVSFRPDVVSGDYLDYPFDFLYDFGAEANNTLINPAFAASNFKIRIYGSVVNPRITVANHDYKLNSITINAGEYLDIDSSNKTIQLVSNSGVITNAFSNRDRSSYIFEKIPPGTSNITQSSPFSFDIILLDERSEPKWT